MKVPQEYLHMKKDPVLHIMCVIIQPHNQIYDVVPCLHSWQENKRKEKNQRRRPLVTISKNMNLILEDSRSI